MYALRGLRREFLQRDYIRRLAPAERERKWQLCKEKRYELRLTRLQALARGEGVEVNFAQDEAGRKAREELRDRQRRQLQILEERGVETEEWERRYGTLL